MSTGLSFEALNIAKKLKKELMTKKFTILV